MTPAMGARELRTIRMPSEESGYDCLREVQSVLPHVRVVDLDVRFLAPCRDRWSDEQAMRTRPVDSPVNEIPRATANREHQVAEAVGAEAADRLRWRAT
jgi:hypothetical protein